MRRNRMEYKGYVGTVEWYEDESIFYGKTLGIKSLITYEGKTIEELRKNFYQGIDNYLEICKKNNLKPDIPYKGSFNIRTSQELYRLALKKAKQENISLSKLVSNALKEYLKCALYNE